MLPLLQYNIYCNVTFSAIKYLSNIYQGYIYSQSPVKMLNLLLFYNGISGNVSFGTILPL